MASQAASLVYDIDDWEALDFYNRSMEVGKYLQQKGFCFIRGGLDQKHIFMAEKEARNRKSLGEISRLPLAAASSLLGARTAAWWTELEVPWKPAPASERALRQVDTYLNEIGTSIASSAKPLFGMNIFTRSPGILYHAKMPDDNDLCPEFEDAQDFHLYERKCTRKKVVLLYHLGPSSSTATIRLRNDDKRDYLVEIDDECVIAYRSDICEVALETAGFSIAVQVDFNADVKTGPQQFKRDELPLPKPLENWFSAHLRGVAQDNPAPGEVPLYLLKQAHETYSKGSADLPVRIVQLWHEFPTLAFFGGSVAPFEASVLGGQDAVTEVYTPYHAKENRPVEDYGSKWNHSEYYDPDPKETANFKIYTKHISVLNRGHNPWDDYDYRDFGVLTLENFTIDRRACMLYEANMQSVLRSNFDMGDTKDQDVGFFVGMTGNDHYLAFIQQEAKITKFAQTNISNAAIVSRMSYRFGSRGACMAIDTEDSSTATALDTAVFHLRHGRCAPFALASGVSFIENPFELVLSCAAGVISPSGRTRVFDETADGFVRGEGVGAFLLELHDKPERIEKSKGPVLQPGEKPYEVIGIRAIIKGSAVNSKGSSSSLIAPSAAAIADLMQRAAKDAGTPFFCVDAVEMNSGGNKMSDAVELGVTLKELSVKPWSSDEPLQSVPIRSAKAIFGNMGPSGGCASLARSCFLLERALHGPTIHLRQLMATAELPEDDGGAASRSIILTEVCEARAWTQTVGVSCFGSTGTQSHQMLWGQKLEEKRRPIQARAVTWWPGGPQKEAKPPLRGYYVVGTWSDWTHCGLMQEEEEEGVYSYAVMMGDNNQELFQIWVDEDNDQVIHPENPCGGPNSIVVGPVEKASRQLSWALDGRAEQVRLVNQDQHARAKEEADKLKASGKAAPEREPRLLPAFPGSNLPPGHTGDPNDIDAMPISRLNESLMGQPGDRYRIRLFVRGKYKRVDWVKVADNDFSPTIAEPLFEHKFHIIGDHNYWTFKEMEPDKSETGLYRATIHLLKDKSSFQVYRDADWDQGFYPRVARGEQNEEIVGPDGTGLGRNWQIVAKVGDIFRVEFRRQVYGRRDDMSMRWEYESSRPVDFLELSKSHKYYMAGSWSDFNEITEMIRDDETGNYFHEITIGKKKMESFQILLNGNWLAAVHPDFNDATLWDDHVLEGPDDGGTDKYWSIGLHPEDQFQEGAHAIVHLVMENGMPKRITWERYDSPDAHREYCARGCQRIFARHCRLLGFVPYHRDDDNNIVKAKATAIPDFMTTSYAVNDPAGRI